MLSWLFVVVLATPAADTTPYALDPIPHLVATGAMAGVVVIAEGIVKPVLLGGFDCALDPRGDRCDAKHLWGFDSSVVGNHALIWRRVSDVGALTALLGGAGALVLDSYLSQSPTPAGDAATDMLVLGETAMLATFLTHTLKFAIRRPRPTEYVPGVYSVENQLSFPSGHTSATAAATTAYSMTFAMRHPDSPWRYAVIGGGIGLTGLVAYGRVGGGMHFYSDVIAGAILGGAVGFLVPYLVRHRAHLDVDFGRDERNGQRLGLGLSVAY